MQPAATAQRPHHRFWPRRLPHAITPPAISLWFNLVVSATRYPDKPALVFFDRTTSYRTLHDQAERLAAHLHAQGVQAGDRVILFMQDCPHLVVAHYHDAIGPEADIPPAWEPWLRSRHPLPALPGGSVADWVDVLACTAAPPAHDRRPEDLSVLPYTSGTTGLPMALGRPVVPEE